MRILVLALRRVAWMPPTLLGLTLIVFTVSHVIPADPARDRGITHSCRPASGFTYRSVSGT